MLGVRVPVAAITGGSEAAFGPAGSSLICMGFQSPRNYRGVRRWLTLQNRAQRQRGSVIRSTGGVRRRSYRIQSLTDQGGFIISFWNFLSRQYLHDFFVARNCLVSVLFQLPDCRTAKYFTTLGGRLTRWFKQTRQRANAGIS